MSEEAERALIGRLLLDTKQIPLVAGSLKPEDFGTTVYGEYFRAMTRLSAEGRPVDIVTLRQVLDRDIVIDPLELTEGHRGPVEEYAGIIRAAGQRRAIISELDYVRDLAASGEGDLLTAVEGAVGRILQRTDDGDVVGPSRVSSEYLNTIMERQAGRDPGMAYGIPGMDQLVLPARRGRLTLLAARPSVGKTAMAESIADHWAAQGQGPVLFVSLEMTREELMDRAVARDTGVSSDRISRGTLDPASLEKVMDAAAKRGAGSVHYLDDGSVTTARIKAAAARLKMQSEGKLAGLVVDYTQLLNDRVGGDNDNQRVAAISRALKQMAGALRCPVLALSQLNRNVEQERRKPRLSDLRDSGALEQDADVVMVLTGRLNEATRTVHILKQRNGRIGEFDIIFEGDTCRWLAPGPREAFREPAPPVRMPEEALGW